MNKATAPLTLLLLILATAAYGGEDPARQWAQWRGPLQTGVAPFADPPIEWSNTKNIRWKAEILGLGHSTPIVWGERIFITTAIATGDAVPPPVGIRPGSHDNMAAVKKQEYVVLALSRRDGKVLWKKSVHTMLPHEGAHETASFASNSPVTDGERVYAFFGSAGLYCLDAATGELRWSKALGQMHSKHGHGEGNSPALRDGILVVNWDHEGPSFIAAFDAVTGAEKWRQPRDELTSWSSPIIHDIDGKPQVLVSATTRIRGYDLSTGTVVWECSGLSSNVVASPVYADGMMIAGSSYEKKTMVAIRTAGAKGDITGTANVAWTRNRDTPYVPSPLLYDDRFYFLKHFQGALTCVRPKTGETVYGPQRIPGILNVYSSPVGAAGRIYVTSREGATTVLKNSDTMEALATNTIDDVFSASPAIAGNEIYLRGESTLYCIAKD